MHLALTSPVTGGIQAELPFVAASGHYNKALKHLEMPTNALIDIKVAVSAALEETTKAVDLLTPVTDHSDPFVSRNASASVHTAKSGVNALKNALAQIELESKGPGGSLIPLGTFLEIATNSIKVAESTLWWE